MFDFKCGIIITAFCATLLLNIAYVECQMNCTASKRATMGTLINDLLCNYDKRVRPTSNLAVPTNVKVDFNPYYIIIDEEYDTIHITGDAKLVWKDDFLVWNTSWAQYRNYLNVRSANLDIWVPEIISLNEGILGFYKGQGSFVSKFFVVNYNGLVTLNAQISLTGHCAIHTHYWPHMRASCNIIAGSPTKDPDIVYNDFTSNMSLQNMRNDSAWQFSSIKSACERLNSNDNCTLSFDIEMVKYAKLYSSPILTPAIVLSILMLVSFWMEYNMLHRLMLSLFVFFGQLIFLAVLSFHLEDSVSESVMIVTFYRNSLLFSTISIIATLLERSMLLQSKLPSDAFVNFIRLFPRTSKSKLFWMIFVGNENTELIINPDEEVSSCGKPKIVIHEWRILASILNRILFFVFFGMTIYFFFKLIP